MKTLELRLKKDVLIVDLPQKVQNFKEVTITNNVLFADGKGNRTCLFIKFRDKLDSENRNEYLEKGFKRVILDYIDGDHEFLCKGSELTEKIASDLVDETIMHLTYGDNKHKYRSYVNYNLGFDNALESFISAVESKGFHWLENPLGEDPKKNKLLGTRIMRIMNMLKYQEWQESEEKTFKNPLIFVKK